MSCKTCKWLGVVPLKDGRIVVRRNDRWPCKAPEPEVPRLPASMTNAYGWRWPPHRNFVGGEDGEGCPCHEPRTPVVKARRKGRATPANVREQEAYGTIMAKARRTFPGHKGDQAVEASDWALDRLIEGIGPSWTATQEHQVHCQVYEDLTTGP